MKKVSEQLKTKAYEIGVMKLLKEVAESGEDVHENHTPLEICDMMLDKVDLVSARSILVLYNIELLFALRKEKYKGQVTFFTQSTKKADLAPKIFEGVVVEYIDKEENPLYFMENQWPDKFDVVIANPPYGDKRNTRLHLNFLEKSFLVAKSKILFVHPSNQYIDQKNSFKNLNEKFSKFLQYVKIFNGNRVFNIEKFFPISIALYNLDKTDHKITIEDSINSKNYVVDTLEKVNVLGGDKEFFLIKEKIIGHCKKENLQIKIINKPKEKGLQKDFFVSISAIRGHIFTEGNKMYRDDFFTLVTKDLIPYNSTQVENLKGMAFQFDSYDEALNFINFCKTDFARFCLALLKTDNNLNSQMWLVPWMDFTQEWTDEKLFSHFNITKEEQAFIKQVIPAYYD